MKISDDAAVEIGPVHAALRGRAASAEKGQRCGGGQRAPIVERDLSKYALDMLGVDSEGLDDGDRKFLTALVELFDGGPVGLSTLAAALNEDTQTIEDIYEPYLIQKGLIERTPRGRKATRNTWDYLGLPVSPRFVQYQQMQLLSEEDAECSK